MNIALIVGVLLIAAPDFCYGRSLYAPEIEPAIGFDGNLFLFAAMGRPDTFIFDTRKSSFTAGPKLPNQFYPTTILCMDGKCLIGGRAGLIEVRGGTTTIVPGAPEKIRSLEQCGESVWIAAETGVFELKQLRVKRHFSKRSGLSSTPAYSLFCNRDQLFIGTYVLRGGDMYGTDFIDEINIRNGKIRRIRIPPSPNADRLAAARYVVAMDRKPNESKIRIVTWAFWNIADVFELDPSSDLFTPAKNRQYYFFESWERRNAAQHPNVLKNYLQFIDWLNQKGMHLYQHGAGGNVPGDIREYFALRQLVDPSSVPSQYEKSPDWIKRHVGPQLSNENQKQLPEQEGAKEKK